MWAKLKVRLISALVGAVFVVAMLFLDPIVFHILIACACCFILYELYKTIQKEIKWPIVAVGAVFAVLLLLVPLFDAGLRSELVVFLSVVGLSMFLICTVLWHETVTFSDAVSSFFCLIYGVIFPMHLIYIRMLDHGLALIFIPLIGAWMPDTFAYFGGMLFGKHKLIPTISPKKTVEGAVGGLVGSLLCFGIYGVIVHYGFDFLVNIPALLFLALLCGVISQLGDLSASVIKRANNQKDFGNLIPGHGGVLDRVDSLMLIAPMVYYFLLVFEVVYK